MYIYIYIYICLYIRICVIIIKKHLRLLVAVGAPVFSLPSALGPEPWDAPAEHLPGWLLHLPQSVEIEKPYRGTSLIRNSKPP